MAVTRRAGAKTGTCARANHPVFGRSIRESRGHEHGGRPEPGTEGTDRPAASCLLLRASGAGRWGAPSPDAAFPSFRLHFGWIGTDGCDVRNIHHGGDRRTAVLSGWLRPRLQMPMDPALDVPSRSTTAGNVRWAPNSMVNCYGKQR